MRFTTSPVIIGRKDRHRVEYDEMEVAVPRVTQPRPDHAHAGTVHAECNQHPRHHAAQQPAWVQVDPEGISVERQTTVKLVIIRQSESAPTRDASRDYRTCCSQSQGIYS